MIPEHVIEEWRERSKHHAERQQQWHEKNHFWPDAKTCRKCQRLAAVCKSKARFDTIEEAQEVADSLNRPNDSVNLLVPYNCFWSEGLHFHNSTVKGAEQVRRARKRMSRLYRTP